MTVLFNPEDDEASAILERAKATGEITLDVFNSMIGLGEVTPDDVADTFAALAEMGIAVVEHITQEEQDRRDDEIYEAMRASEAKGRHTQWNGEAWASFLRAAARKKAG